MNGQTRPLSAHTTLYAAQYYYSTQKLCGILLGVSKSDYPFAFFGIGESVKLHEEWPMTSYFESRPLKHADSLQVAVETRLSRMV